MYGWIVAALVSGFGAGVLCHKYVISGEQKLVAVLEAKFNELREDLKARL